MYNEKQIAMKHLSFLFAALLCCIASNAQQPQKLYDCNSEVFLDIDLCEDDSIPIYNNAKRDSVIAYAKNKCEKELFISFKIMHKKADMLHVVAYYPLELEQSFEGWISIKNPLGIYTRAYATSLTLYSLPSEDSTVQCIIDEYDPEMYSVIDCRGEWLKVRRVLHGKVYVGWIPPEMQCSNQYSTCP